MSDTSTHQRPDQTARFKTFEVYISNNVGVN